MQLGEDDLLARRLAALVPIGEPIRRHIRRGGDRVVGDAWLASAATRMAVFQQRIEFKRGWFERGVEFVATHHFAAK